MGFVDFAKHISNPEELAMEYIARYYEGKLEEIERLWAFKESGEIRLFSFVGYSL